MSIKPEFLIERQGKTFVLYAGLLDLAHAQGLRAIRTRLIQVPDDDNGLTAIVSAEVETDRGTYAGIGDANPANVSRMMLTNTIRLAETRAKARALRDAVNVGVAALEELGDTDDMSAPQPTQRQAPSSASVSPAPQPPPPSATPTQQPATRGAKPPLRLTVEERERGESRYQFLKGKIRGKGGLAIDLDHSWDDETLTAGVRALVVQLAALEDNAPQAAG